MPWHLGTSDQCPASKPHAVIKDSDGSVAGCHPTEGAAKKQMAALYANEPGMMMSDTLPPARLPFPVTRAMSTPVELRSSDDPMPTMHVVFSTYNDPYEVHSALEGRFIERIAPGAFRKTIAESRSRMKALYDHGQDPTIGNKILGPIADLREGATGPEADVPLFDTSYNRDLRPGLEAGVYGSSFRFSVEKDEWDDHPTRSDSNPDGLPERTITEARVYEFGPVTFPANPSATAGVRSTTDTYYKRSRDPEQYEELLRSAQAARTLVEPAKAATPSDEPPDVTPEVEPTKPDTLRSDPPPDQPATIEQDPPDGGSLSTRSKSVEDNMTLEEMRSRREELDGEMADLLAAHPGDLPEDEQVRYDAAGDERDILAKKIAKREANEARLANRAQNPANIERVFDPSALSTQKAIIRKSDAELHSPESRSATYEGREAEFADDAKRILEKTKFAYGLSDQSRSEDKVAHLIDADPKGEMARRVKFTSSPAYLRAFDKFVKSGGGTYFLTPEEQRGTALAVGVDATGGFTVPFAFDPTIIAIGAWTGAVNPYRSTCRVVTISGTDTWNAITSTAVVATRTTEAAASTEQGPTFAQPQYVVKRVQGQITASFEMFQDRADLGAEMATLIAEAKDNEEEASWATGNGSGAASIGVGPVSGTSGSYTRISTAGAGAIAAGDADATEAGLPVRHRFRAQWFMPRTNIRKFQSVETAGGKLFGGNQYQAVGNVALSPSGNTGLRLLGYPVNESPSLPTATTTTITAAVLLNTDQYVIVDRVGMSVQFIPFIFNSSALATGQQALYFIYRNHAAPLNTDSGRILQFL